MVEFYRRKLWKHWKVFQQHAKIRCIICWRICHPSLLFEWKNHVIRSRPTSENNLGTNRLQKHSFLQNLLEVNVHTITEELDFVLASKGPNVTAKQISTINWINVVTEKCKLHETLKTFCEGKTNSLPLEVSSKIQYANCLRAEEPKYHHDCMQRFLSGRSVGESQVNRQNFQEANNMLFERFREWDETTAHESITLFHVQKWIEEFQGDSTEEVYTLKTINWKLKAKYGDSLRFTSCEGPPSIMLLHEEAD